AVTPANPGDTPPGTRTSMVPAPHPPPFRPPPRCLTLAAKAWAAGFADRELPHLGGAERAAAHRPVTARHLLHPHPRTVPHALSLDRHHRVRHGADHRPLLPRGEHALDQLHRHQRHGVLRLELMGYAGGLAFAIPHQHPGSYNPSKP